MGSLVLGEGESLLGDKNAANERGLIVTLEAKASAAPKLKESAAAKPKSTKASMKATAKSAEADRLAALAARS